MHTSGERRRAAPAMPNCRGHRCWIPREFVAWRSLTAVALVFAAACGAAPSPSASPVRASTANGAPSIAPDIDAAIRFRQSTGLRSDLAWVVKVAADADDQLRAQVYGIPLTQDELALLDARATNAAQVGPTVERYGAEHLDEWAGAYVDDDPNVGVIARFTGNLAVHEAQLRTILNPNARFSVQTARWNKRQLISLSEQIARDSSWLESIGASFEAADVSIQDNAVILTVRADSDGVRAVIAERYDGEGGLTVMIVSRSPAWSGGFGSVAIAARSRTGDPVSGFDVRDQVR